MAPKKFSPKIFYSSRNSERILQFVCRDQICWTWVRMFFEGCFRLSCTRQTFFISTMLLRTFSRLRCFFSSACSRLKNPKRMQRMRSQTAFVFSWNGIRSVNITGVKKVWCKEQKVLEANTVLLKHKEITIPANQAMGDSEQVKKWYEFSVDTR